MNGVQNGPGPFNGFVATLADAKAEFERAWGIWLKIVRRPTQPCAPCP
jgi:hypothetical protein